MLAAAPSRSIARSRSDLSYQASILPGVSRTFAGITDPAARAKLVSQTIFPVARFLVGNDLADKLRLPKSGMLKKRFALSQFRMNTALGKLLRRNDHRLVEAFGASLYDNAGLSYDMPDHVRAE